ncbi:MAG: DUF3828 domain-containing protein [Caulobacteraceae bacterium]|nr:DUF3828 domain-containing protein [Caulobacteraceae bacterium]
MTCQFLVRGGVVPLACCVLALGACGKPAQQHTEPSPPAAAAPAPAAAPNPDAASAKAFLEGLYAHYASAKDNTFQPFDANVHEVFDPDMVRLLDADTKALKGELGDIDGDWLCQCQDFVSLRAAIAVQSAAPTEAKATADVTDLGMPGEKSRHDAFDLVKVGGAWRIHDIVTPDQGSLRQTLLDEIKRLKAGGRPDSG